MAEIINLNRVRKARQKADAAREAEVNRAAFGRTKAERRREEEEKERAARELEGKRIE